MVSFYTILVFSKTKSSIVLKKDILLSNHFFLLLNIHEQNSTYSVFMQVYEIWQTSSSLNLEVLYQDLVQVKMRISY